MLMKPRIPEREHCKLRITYAGRPQYYLYGGQCILNYLRESKQCNLSVFKDVYDAAVRRSINTCIYKTWYKAVVLLHTLNGVMVSNLWHSSYCIALILTCNCSKLCFETFQYDWIQYQQSYYVYYEKCQPLSGGISFIGLSHRSIFVNDNNL